MTKPLPWRWFLARRLARIVPLYWFFLALKLLFIRLSHVDPTGASHDPLFVLGSFLFVPVYRASMDGVFPLIVAGWTLNYEMYFYLVCALTLALLPRRTFPIAVALYMIAAALLGILLEERVQPMTVPPIVLLRPLCLEFVAGMAIAVAWTRGVRVRPVIAAAALAIGAAGIIVAPATVADTHWRALAWGVPAAAIVFGLVYLETALPFRRWTLPLLIGDASYALYLSHTAILPVLYRFVARLPGGAAVQGAVLIVGCVAGGVLVHRLIERPLLQAATRLLRLRARTPQRQHVPLA